MNHPTTDLAADAADFLRELKRGGVVLGLDRMRAFVAELGHPETQVPVIHVAGTNGKGSVAAMVEAILRGAGWRTGLYTSPHLVRLGERVQVNRAPIRNDELAAEIRAMRPAVEALVRRGGRDAQPSYFEFMTALAFRHFGRVGCEVAVVEVGMGGRLDATNVVMPEVSVITSIGLDHCEFLGGTVAAIAGEKAGIIKPGRPVVVGRVPAEAESVIRQVAGANHAPVRTVAEEFGTDPASYPPTALDGAYQRLNAATAVLAARQLAPGWRVTSESTAAALRNVQWSGRWQRLDVGGRTVLIDAAHNAEGAEALDRNLAALVAETGRAPVVVTGALGASRARALLEVIARHARVIRLVVPAQRRACPFEQLEALVPATFRGRIVRDSVAAAFPAPGVCLPQLPPEDVVVVTGSLYLAGEVLARLNPDLGPLEAEWQDF